MSPKEIRMQVKRKGEVEIEVDVEVEDGVEVKVEIKVEVEVVEVEVAVDVKVKGISEEGGRRRAKRSTFTCENNFASAFIPEISLMVGKLLTCD